MNCTTVSSINIPTEYAGLLATQLLLAATAEQSAQIERASPILPLHSASQSKVSTTLTPVEEIAGAKTPWAIKSTSLPASINDNWQSLAKSGLGDEAFARLQMLAALPDGWRGAGSKKLNSASLRYFLRFWTMLDAAAEEPFITLAPNGNLYAEWHASWKRHLDTEFAPDGSVYFGLFHNADSVEGKMIWSDLMATMTARRQNPFSWKYVRRD